MTDKLPANHQSTPDNDGAGLNLSKNSPNTNPPNTPKPKWRIYCMRLFVVILAVLVLIVALLFFVIGTDTGTKFVLEQIVQKTGVTLSYQQGNLRSGVQVSDLVILQNKDMEIKANQAYVKLGWRAVFGGQVHLASASIDRLDVINKNPPTGEPFDYPTLDLPINLYLEDTHAKTVSLVQADGKGGFGKPLYLRDISLVSGKWVGTKAVIQGGQINVDDVVIVNNAHGEITLSGDYPLNATADVDIPIIKKAYFDTLHANAKGTLKRSHGTVISKYNQSDIHGSFAVQGLDEGSPFSAKLYVPHAVLPYAEEQNITLDDGVITAEGVISRIELRLNTDLMGRDVPTGRYHGRAVVREGGMDIERLVADTASGQLNAHGNMEWSDEFELNAVAQGSGVKVREFMPIEYRDYEAYLPKTLDGTLGFGYFYLDKINNETRLEFDLQQKDGERVQAVLAQSQDRPDSPWRIHADWQNLVRANVPNIETINSPHGTANIRLEEGRTYIDGKVNVKALSVAPIGDYDIKMNIEKGERLHLTDVRYAGELGDLTAKGRIDLATAYTPLAWQFDLNTTGLKPNAYFDTPNQTPFSLIKGNLLATGRLREEKAEGGNKPQIHEITLVRSDLIATLMGDKKTPDSISLAGSGKANVRLVGSELTYFDSVFDGKLGQSFMPKVGTGHVKLLAKGDLQKIHIDTLNFNSKKGNIKTNGSLSLTDGIGWDLTARLDGVDTSAVGDNADMVAVITGDVKSTGLYKNDKLADVKANFHGQVTGNKLPNGTLALDVQGKNHQFVINRLYHRTINEGEPSELSATGTVDADKLAWDLTAQMTRFNAGAFVRGAESELTGKLHTVGTWGDKRQKVSVKELALTGQLREQSFFATGSLSVDMSLPKDFKGYFKQLKSRPEDFDLQSLTDFQKQLEKNTHQTRQMIHALHAEKVQLRMGDNVVSMHGDEKHLTTALNLTDLSQLMPTTRGAIKGGLILVDDRRALPTVYVDLNASEVWTAELILQKAGVVGKVVNLGDSPSQLLVEVSDVIAMGRVIKSARLDFKGTQDKHELAITTKNASVEARAKVVGGFDGQTYAGVLGEGRMETRFGLLSQRQPSEFSIGLNQSIKIAPHCWQTSKTRAGGTGSLCLQDTLVYTPNEIKADLVVQQLDTSVLSPVLPSDIFWHSKLNGKAKISHKKGNVSPQIQAVLYSDNGRVGLYGDDTGYVDMPYERVSIIAQSVANGLKLRTDIKGAIGQGYADVVVNPFGENKPISGAVVATDVNLAVLRPFLPSLQTLSGKASLQGGLGGTLTRPLFYGNAELTDGRLRVMGVPLDLTEIEANVAIAGTQAEVMTNFKGGQGKGVIAGKVDWHHELQAKFNLSADDLTISQPPLITAQLTPDVEVILKPLSKYVDIKGVVSVPSATIRPPEAQGSVVVESPDVSVLDRRLSGNVAKVLAVSAPWSINVDLGLDLGDDVVFRGFGAKLPLAGALHLTQSGQGVMKARGVVQVSERTKIDGVGQNLELNYAQIRFNGDMLNPRLSIEGEKEVEGSTVGVRVKGTANAPEISVFNNAGLTEQQAMNAIITGRLDPSADSQISEQGFRSQVTNNLAAAGLSLGLSGTRSLTNQLGNALGLESLTVDASGNSSDTHVNITGYISPDLYIRYGVGVFNAQTELSMRYQLTRRVYVEATSGAEKLVDVIYRWKF